MQIDISNYLNQIQAYSQNIDYGAVLDSVRDAFEKEMRLRLSWNTNSLEGNTLSLDETIDVIEYDEVRSGHTYTEYEEAKNAYKAFSAMLNFRKEQTITEDYIRKTNGLIMGSDGNYRTTQVYIGNLAEVAFLPSKPDEIRNRMTKYVKTIHSGPALTKGIDSSCGSDQSKNNLKEMIAFLAKAHMEFEMIHPFRDGNGRTGRLILDQMLINAGLLPAIILNQSKYRQAFRFYERNQDTSLMEYCIVTGVAESYHILKENSDLLM